MAQQIVLGLGAGQCGLHLLAEILQRQTGTRVTFEQPPILPWLKKPDRPGIRERIARWKDSHSEPIVGDVAAFYLPYVQDAIECEPCIRIICLKRPRSEVIAGFVRNLDKNCRVRTNHWSIAPSPGWYHDPLWTPSFPQYPTSNREEAIGLYWDEYYQRADEFARQYASNFLLIDPDELTELTGVRRVLEFIGIPGNTQNSIVGHRSNPSAIESKPSPPPSRGPLDPARCVVLVPYNGVIYPECEDALKELERRGYTVRRVSGYAAIDQGRNQMVTDALIDGFEETLWIDSDVGFYADDVERLRSHPVAIVSGIYPQKGKRSLASQVLPGTPNITFGEAGGLVEMLYAATGFLLVRREAYLTIQRELKLPICNERFGRALLPFFMPSIHKIDDGHWYLAEDYSFCERARQCGFKIYADTRLRLWHIGTYRYGWEDAGIDRQRFGTFTLNFSDNQPEGSSQNRSVDP